MLNIISQYFNNLFPDSFVFTLAKNYHQGRIGYRFRLKLRKAKYFNKPTLGFCQSSSETLKWKHFLCYC